MLLSINFIYIEQTRLLVKHSHIMAVPRTAIFRIHPRDSGEGKGVSQLFQGLCSVKTIFVALLRHFLMFSLSFSLWHWGFSQRSHEIMILQVECRSRYEKLSISDTLKRFFKNIKQYHYIFSLDICSRKNFPGNALLTWTGNGCIFKWTNKQIF